MEQQNMVESSVINGPETGHGTAADTQAGMLENTPAPADEGAEAAALIAEGMCTNGQGESNPTALAEQAAAPGRTYTQADFDAAVRRKMELATRGMREKLEKDPYYVLGKQMMEEGERMNTNNMQAGFHDLVYRETGQRENALQPLSQAVKQAAANMPLPPAAQRELSEKPAVARIGQELFQSMLDGDVPQNLNVADYVKIYPQFLSDCTQFGVKAALRTVDALRGAQENQRSALQKATRNNALPHSLRPAFNQITSGAKDYLAMSDAEFKKAKEEFKQAYLNGKKLPL